MGDVELVDIGNDLDKYVEAILQNRGSTTNMLVLTSDDGDADIPMSQVMAEVALRVVERVFGPPSEWNLWELTDDQWDSFKSLFLCTEWLPCVACPLNLPQFYYYNHVFGKEEGSFTIPGHFLWQSSDFDPGVNTCVCIPNVGEDRTQLLMWMVPTTRY